jgi:hypothetical protein
MKKSILESSNYFLKCEFLNKYHLTSIFEKPSVTKVVLYFSLTQIINSFSINKNLTPIDAFYLFYSNLSIFPFLTFNLISVKKDQTELFDSKLFDFSHKTDKHFFKYSLSRFTKLTRSINVFKVLPKYYLKFCKLSKLYMY